MTFAVCPRSWSKIQGWALNKSQNHLETLVSEVQPLINDSASRQVRATSPPLLSPSPFTWIKKGKEYTGKNELCILKKMEFLLLYSREQCTAPSALCWILCWDTIAQRYSIPVCPPIDYQDKRHIVSVALHFLFAHFLLLHWCGAGLCLNLTRPELNHSLWDRRYSSSNCYVSGRIFFFLFPLLMVVLGKHSLNLCFKRWRVPDSVFRSSGFFRVVFILFI